MTGGVDEVELFTILVYDVNQRRVAKVLKKCRQYLNWVQNSVFEGEISEANLKKIKDGIGQNNKKRRGLGNTLLFEDNEIFFKGNNGIKKGGDENII